MANFKRIVVMWGPVVLWMAVIFAASATPSVDIPSFGTLDYIVKKAGHATAYALLALLIRRAIGWESKRPAGAWLIAVLYALTDELHQSLVPGRHPSIVDALVFDGGGAAAALLLSAWLDPLLKRHSGREAKKT